jgi:predicted nucleic acid-binding protein
VADPIVVNTGPLVSFARIGCLDMLAGLDLGEAAVIQLALDVGVRTVAIDEWKGRRAALASGLRVTGSLGLLGRAKAQGLIPELKPLITKAIDAGIWYNRDLVRAFLEAAGE